MGVQKRTYNDVEVEFNGNRKRLTDSSYGLRLTCTRASGWELWNIWGYKEELLAGEFHTNPLTVFVGGDVVCGIVPNEENEMDVTKLYQTQDHVQGFPTIDWRAKAEEWATIVAQRDEEIEDLKRALAQCEKNIRRETQIHDAALCLTRHTNGNFKYDTRMECAMAILQEAADNED